MQDDKLLNSREKHEAWVAAHSAELDRARERIGRKTIESARWLLNRFYEVELSSLSAGNILDLKWEVWVFGHSPRPEYLGTRPLTLPEDVDLSAFQDIVSEVATAMLGGKTLSYKFPSYVETFVVLPGVGPMILSEFDNDEDIYRSKVLAVLAAAYAAFGLARCAACERVFVKRQDTQAYCSVRCQTRVSVREVRKRAKEEAVKKGRAPKKARPTRKSHTTTKGGK